MIKNAIARLLSILLVAAAALLCAPPPAQAQHLWWNLEGQKDATCLYGEITVIATAPHIYYCGANWHPGEPAGGYCGIQHNSEKERRTIFSIWDTTAALHPNVTAADPKTIHNRFGGEGEGGHTHMLWPWKTEETFQFYVHKQPGKADTTDTSYYIYDRAAEVWRHSATINSPIGGKSSVATIGGGLNSFLENFAGKDKQTPKVALYRLWLGTRVETMKCLTKARGDGTWGQLHGAYFLAEGEAKALEAVFASSNEKYGEPVKGEKGKKLDPIPDAPVPEKVIAALKSVPKAKDVSPPQEKLAACAKKYAALRTYQDTGNVKCEIMKKGQPTTKTDLPFSTAFERDGRFLWEFRGTQTPKGEPAQYVVWSKDQKAFQTRWTATGENSEQGSIGSAMAGPAGISGGSADAVIPLLRPDMKIAYRTTDITSPTDKGTDKIDGKTCTIIDGWYKTSAGNYDVAIWLDEDLLIRKIVQQILIDPAKSNGVPATPQNQPYMSRDTITISPVADGKIDDRAFEPPPAAKK